MGDHKAAAIAVVVLYLSIRLVSRVERHGGDYRVIQLALAVDAGVVAWAIWDEVRRRRR
jgi:NO-binding membrane sensor protein with MHYT domain